MQEEGLLDSKLELPEDFIIGYFLSLGMIINDNI